MVFMPTAQIITLVIIIVAVLLFITNRVRSDLVGLMVMVALGLTGVISAEDSFSGFSSSAVMTILGISMISVALQMTGATNSLGKIMLKLGKGNQTRLVLMVASVSAMLSLFMNNIAAVGVLLPAVMSLARRSHVSPSRLLMPLAYGTILGGMATLFTTSNIIVSGAMREAGLPSFGLLDYFPIGGPVMIVGVLYLAFVGVRMLPAAGKIENLASTRELTERLSDLYQVKKNLVQFELLPGSPLANKSLAEGCWYEHYRLNILAVIRKKETFFSPEADLLLQPGDILIARGTITEKAANMLHLKLTPFNLPEIRITDESHPFSEIILSSHSRLIGKNLRESNFRDRYGLSVVGIWRNGKPVESDHPDLPLQFGDALLVTGPALHIRNLHDSDDLVVLEEDPDAVLLPRKGAVTILITFATLFIAAIGIIPVALAAIGGALLLILTGSMRINEAYRGIEWKAIFLIAGLWPLSIALHSTGLADIAVTSLLSLLGPVHPLVLIGVFLALSMTFTLLISGQVSALVMIPLALAAAQTLGMDVRPFGMAVAMGCSLAFITPLGHPVNIMVMNAGGYEFKDYAKVGLPLTIISFGLILFLIHLYWGL
jgi:di/tricarboxylate transporter